MRTQIDPHGMIGSRYGDLTVVAFHGYKRTEKYWHAICDCGRHYIGGTSDLRRGHTKSCGCIKANQQANLQHGFAKMKSRDGAATPEYNAWGKMKARCLNPSNPKFADYGGRGIQVCDEWLDDFPAFLKSVGLRPTDKHSLGRIDNDKGYEPGNCRWETARQQGANKRNNRYLIIDGKPMLLADCARLAGVPASYVTSRLRSGNFTPEQAISIPFPARKPRRKST